MNSLHTPSLRSPAWSGRCWLQNGLLALSLMLIVIFGFYGCSAGSDATSADSNSELVISLTDAEGDFLSYTVDVQSIKMRKSNGAEVEVLPLTTRLDFARYVEVTEFLTAATVPAGHYTGARIVLDFSNASIVVQDPNGNAISATPQDSSGNPAGIMTLDLSFNGDRDFVIAPGIPAHITLDFDLDASNDIILNGSTATVMVKPVLLADTQLEAPKPHRLRGLLGRVDEADNSFNVLMRPFRHKRNNRFGQLNVHVSDNTAYEIDGTVYGGASGLSQLASLDPAAAVIVLGKLALPRNSAGGNTQGKPRFNALEVYAGSSVPWGNKDMVSGNVTARSGDSLVIRGATLIRADGSFAFSNTLQVSLSSNTRVVKQGDISGSYTKDDISVGQRVNILGRLTPGTGLGLNADHVRMLYTHIGGSVVSVSPLNIDLQGIDRHRIQQFDFSGTGSDPTSDADASNYEVDTASLSLSGVRMGDPLKVLGHVRPFGSAPQDFSAQSIVDAANMRAHLVTDFIDGSVNAISSISDSGILLDLQQAASRHYMYRAGISTDLLGLSSMPLIMPTPSATGLFVISRGSSIRVYTLYSSFQTALNGLLDGTVAVKAVHANGVYNSDLNQLSSSKISVRLAP